MNNESMQMQSVMSVNIGCEFLTDNFTCACLFCNLMFHFIFISALQIGIKLNQVHINYLDF